MPLRIDREDHVVVITIDNPPLNLFPDEYMDEFAASLMAWPMTMTRTWRSSPVPGPGRSPLERT